MDMDQLRAFAARYAAAWCSQDPASVAAHFSTGGSLQVNDAAPAVGRIPITEVARGFMTAFPDMQVSCDDVTAEGKRTLFRWTLTGTNTGPGGTGRAVRISGYEEWTFDGGGLIARSLGHFDEAAYRHQLQYGSDAPAGL